MAGTSDGAAQFLSGQTLIVQNIYQERIYSTDTAVVDSTAGSIEVPAWQNFLSIDAFDIDATRASILIRVTFGRPVCCVSNLLVFTKSALAPFTNVTLGAYDLPGVTPSRLTYTANTISFDLGGLYFDPTNFVRIDIPAFPREIPFLTMAVSEVRLCWQSLSNKTYQVQYRSDLTTNEWVNLSAPVTGNGGTNCVTDAVGGPRRFYQVIASP
jgi:hypothetical protein